MSTRKLILVALACGLAILIAGSIQLLRIKDNEVSTLAEGDSTEVATRTVSVLSSEVRDDAVLVVARLTVAPTAAVAVSDAVVGWSLVTGGRTEEVAAQGGDDGPVPSCAGLSVLPGQQADCVLRFPVVAKGATVVTYQLGEDQATWTLAG